MLCPKWSGDLRFDADLVWAFVVAANLQYHIDCTSCEETRSFKAHGSDLRSKGCIFLMGFLMADS